MNYSELFASELTLINNYLENRLKLAGVSEAELRMAESVNYTLLSGGKRFRPLLSLLTARALGQDLNQVLPFGSAVEMIHAYSLAHDDLPCMDDDDERRGKPTNHKVYGEALALLAGDALQSLAFETVAEFYKDKNTAAGLEATMLLAKAAGVHGMVGGQAIDIEAIESVREQNQTANYDEALVKRMHALKTGALIKVAVEGAAILCEATEEQTKNLATYAEELGFCFQLADDLLDYDESNLEPSGYPTLVGLDQTKQLLESHSKVALDTLADFSEAAQGLRQLIEFNQSRTK